jgi:hypothetical protein
MKMLLVSAIASACLAGFVGVFGNLARKPRPITGGRQHALVHGVRIALTDAELLDAACRQRHGSARRVG